jgi:hypothetical protein
MMGAIEFFCVIAQIFLSFTWGSTGLAVGIIVVFVIYVAINITFFCLFNKKIKLRDEKFKLHGAKNSPGRKGAIATEVLSVVFSWKFIKLFYSHFLGTRVKVAEFSNPWEFESL